MVFMNDCYLLNLDGTGYFSSNTLYSDACMEKVSAKTGQSSFYLQAVRSALVHPDFKEVIPLCSEIIRKQDVFRLSWKWTIEPFAVRTPKEPGCFVERASGLPKVPEAVFSSSVPVPLPVSDPAL